MTDDPRKKKPAAPPAPPARPAPARPAPARPKPEAFIGHESMTMMGDETFADFERRMAEDQESDGTAPVPVHVPGKKPAPPAVKARPAPPVPSVVEEEEEAPEEEAPEEEPEASDDDEAVDDDADDSLPDEYDGDDESADDDSDASDDDDDQPKGQHARPGFRPKDRDGVQWDYVTHEGAGFNDADDEDAMTFEKNGKTYFKPDWGDWKIGDFVGYWTKHFDIEGSQEGGEKNFQATLKKHGLRNRNHWKRVTATFLNHYAKDPEFTNAALVARQEGVRSKMRDAVKPGMLDPVEGVSLQVWAGINAKLISAGGDMAALKKLLAPHKIDEAKWARASETWNARMSDQSNPDAAMAIATEYGKAFASGGAGAYGASAQEASSSMGINDKVAGKKVKGAEPVSFERWVEIQTAQGVWAQQGKDVNAMLKKVFGLTAVDWSNMSAHWSQKLSTDYQLAGKYGELNAKYTAQYSAGDADPDGDLEV